MGPHGRRAAVQLTAIIGLAVFTFMTFRSVARTQRASEEAMEAGRRNQAFFQVNAVALSFSRFMLDHKRLPRDLKELDPKASYVDPWGTPLRYQVIEPQPMWFAVGSAGPDRVFETEDDIVHRTGK